VSSRDLGGERGAAMRKGTNVSDLMTPQAVTAKPVTTIRQAANLMRGRTIGCLPVLEDGKLKGIVTVTDLLELLGRGLERPVARTERAMLSRRHKKFRKMPASSRD
jgi:acetoin utilization protein AcuB